MRFRRGTGPTPSGRIRDVEASAENQSEARSERWSPLKPRQCGTTSHFYPGAISLNVQSIMLTQIIEAIDEELNRLYQARALLADLDRGRRHKLLKPKPKSRRKRKLMEAIAAPAPPPAVEVVKLPPKPERKRRAPKSKSPLPEPRALTSRIPERPVVVPPTIARPTPPAEKEYSGPSAFGASVLAVERELTSNL